MDQNSILNAFTNKEWSLKDLEKEFSLHPDFDFVDFHKTINKMIEENILFEYHDKLLATKNYNIDTLKKEYGRLFVHNKEIYNSDDFGLLVGDEIIYEEVGPGAICLKVLKRKNIYVLGTILKRKNRFYFYSDDIKFANYTVTNFKEYQKQIKENLRVRTTITNYCSKTLKIDTILGMSNQEEVLIKTILLMNDAPKAFSKETIQECKNLDTNISLNDRIDLRNLDFITIDGLDAKDFDDAIYVERIEDGYLLYVSIADVSYYVQENSALDIDALTRGCSIYYPGNVIPMLPEILCNDLCSLKQGVDRYTITVKMHIDFSGNVLDYDLFPSVIQSKKRADYPRVNKLLEHDPSVLQEYQSLSNMIYTAYKLSRILDHNRKQKGGLEFESNEPIIIEKNGKVLDIQIRQDGKAETMIEDFMIIANEVVATHCYYAGVPILYRNHDLPKADKLEHFVFMMKDLGYDFKGNKQELKSSQLQACLSYYKDKPEYSLISKTMLRTMSKALYRSSNIGHYGLGLDYYCHFTSPIRRYSDLLTHRNIRSCLFHKEFHNFENKEKELEGITNKVNEAEKRATAIERNVVDLKKCEYMKDRIGKSYEGIISSVLPFGLYVELDNSIEGLVPINSFPPYYDFEEDTITNGEMIYKVGMKVKIKVVSVDLIRRTIDFLLFNVPF